MRFSLLLAPLLLSLSTYAHISGIVYNSKTYKPTLHSNYAIQFKFIDGATTEDTFAAAFGIQESGASYAGPSALQNPFAVVNLFPDTHALGSRTYMIPLHKDQFTAGSGKYVITAAVMDAFGANENVQVQFFNTTIKVQL